jgi:DEAD/DEAH box helicase domain-containing protein
LVNPDNLLILLGHLRCAAFELPFREGEGFGKVTVELLKDFLAYLQQEGSLHKSGNKYFWMADQYPAQTISLRSASADAVVLQTSDESGAHTIGEVDPPSAPWMVHPGAVYLHEAQSYLVEELDLEQHIARLRPAQVDYYTEPRNETTIELLQKAGETSVSGGYRGHGEIMVTTHVVGYRKVRWHTYENLGYGDLDLPPLELATTGYWIKFSEETVARLQNEGLWSNASNDYGPGWAVQRQRTRLRDGYRCQMCGIREAGREHDVHHKIPFRAFNSAEIANQLTNLITLCPTCHRRAEQAVRVRSGLAGLAFVLGNLAPLFLMCDARDLGLHSDSQASLAEGHPAVVLYDHVPAGIGFSERLYEMHAELVQQAHELVATCACADGCPSCVGPGGEGGSGGKKEAMALLQALCSSE